MASPRADRPASLAERCLSRLTAFDPKQPEGIVRSVTGLRIEAQGPAVAVGSVVEVSGGHPGHAFRAEVIGFQGGRVVLMPYEGGASVRLGDRVRPAGLSIPEPDMSWIGRVVDGLGRPLDDGPPLTGPRGVARRATVTNPLLRVPLAEPLSTGIRAIDSLTPCARGQRIGLFGGSGVGKSTLLAQMARGSSADVAVVALIGERGREVREFVDNELGVDGLRRSVVVASTSDSEALLRLRAAATALSVAEALSSQRLNVLLIMDSLTRVAMAQREVGLTAGEPPTSRGYTPSVFALLPRIVERAGNFARGSITAFFTVLVEGDDMNDPIADSTRSLLDGHIVLSRALAERAHFPAIDVSASLSRLTQVIATPAQRALGSKLRTLLGAFRKAEDLIAVGAYVPGHDATLDEAVTRMPAIEAFLRQPFEQSLPAEESRKALEQLFAQPFAMSPAAPRGPKKDAASRPAVRPDATLPEPSRLAGVAG